MLRWPDLKIVFSDFHRKRACCETSSRLDSPEDTAILNHDLAFDIRICNHHRAGLIQSLECASFLSLYCNQLFSLRSDSGLCSGAYNVKSLLM